jgi:hypothetical protein
MALRGLHRGLARWSPLLRAMSTGGGRTLEFCIVGSGPAGFYVADRVSGARAASQGLGALRASFQRSLTRLPPRSCSSSTATASRSRSW